MKNSAFKKPNIAGEGCRLDLREGGVMVALFCKKVSAIVGNVLFHKGNMNEPVMVNQAKLFPSNYTNRVVRLFTALLQSVAHIY